jgi:hypothetical protein
MQLDWLTRVRAWGDRHPRIGAFLETFAHINAIVIGLWASMAIAVDALLIGLHTSQRTASRDGIVISPTGKVAWVVTGAVMAIGALLYARYPDHSATAAPASTLAAMRCDDRIWPAHRHALRPYECARNRRG